MHSITRKGAVVILALVAGLAAAAPANAAIAIGNPPTSAGAIVAHQAHILSMDHEI